jgi:hypothetical protein
MIKNLSKLKYLFLAIIFICQGGTSILVGQTQSKYSVTFKNMTVEAAIKKLQVQLGINFFYDSYCLREEKKIINKDFNNRPLSEILNFIFENTNLSYRIVNNVIIIAKKNSDGKVPKEDQEDNRITLKGIVTNNSMVPIEMALIRLPDLNLWGTSDSKGNFIISKITAGNIKIQVSCLGYQKLDTSITSFNDIENIVFSLNDENLTLKSVVVTATENKKSMNTSINIDKQAIDHLQLMSATDLMSLLPGGRTANSNLFYLSDNIFNIRGGDGNGNFGTAVEVDGIRLSSNSNVSTMFGVDTRNLPVSNFESVEIITGIPSVEYGDLTSGIVKIKTKKGRTPYLATVSLNPTTKQFSISKGFDLLKDRGILNVNIEYAKAFQNPVTPYRTYHRNGYNLNYTNTFNRERKPLQLNISIGGTIGLLDAKTDPDKYQGTWSSAASNMLLFGTTANWLLNSKYLTSLDFSVNASYRDDIQKENEYYSYATIRPSINSTESGYYETNYLPVQFYNLQVIDSKSINIGASIKASLNKKYGDVMNKLKAGIGWSCDGNIGKGEYYADNLYPNGYRPRPYSDLPFLHNWNVYAEDNVTIPIGKTSLSVVGGLRTEGIYVKGMAYNNVVSLSPRFNSRYTIINKKTNNGLLRELSIRGGWGMVEKLPSFSVLYPENKYYDILVYSKNYGTQNNYYYVANTHVFSDWFNPDLKWSRSRNIELGIEANISGINASLVYYNNKSISPYVTETHYVPYSYCKSDENYAVPNNPEFKVDHSTGDIYVKDKDNPSLGEVLIPKSVIDTVFIAQGMQSNGDPSTRQGVELSLDFGRIESIRTSFKLDASYSYSKSISLRLKESYPASRHSTLPTTSGRSYEFIAYYLGGTGSNQTYNGNWEDGLSMNLTTTTHIPEIRMTLSLRLEGSIFTRTQNLTYYNGKEWAFLTDNNGNKIEGSVYKQKEYYTGVWPVAYKGFDGIVHPFTETEANDPRFASMIGEESNVYTYVLDGYGAYFMSNISLTKEIGNLVSISFYANNFTKSNPYIKSWATGVQSAKNISFSYGATLRIKF